MDRYLGDWMEDKSIVPTNEEVANLYLIVEEAPYEFDYDCYAVLNRAEDQGLNRLFLHLVIFGKRDQELVE